MRIYIAGGAVRDLILGRTPKDKDYLVTQATEAEFKQAFASARQVGNTFPVFLVGNVEFSFPRGNSVEEDMRSRDLTINAMALSEDGELVCHPHALDDIKNKILRPASEKSFYDDPLRVLRAARFYAAFEGFTPHPELLSLMRAVAEKGLLAGLTQERVCQETRKALASPRPGNYFRLLAQTGCLLPWFEELANGMGIPAGPPQWHNSDILEHTCRVADRCGGNELAAWMAVCHDLGKTLTDPTLLPKHHGHDKAGMAPAEKMSVRLGMPNAFIAAAQIGARHHMKAAHYHEMRASTRVDLLMLLHGKRLMEPFFEMTLADSNNDYRELAQSELQIILAEHLPPEKCNLGPKSAEILRNMRIKALQRFEKKIRNE